MRYEHNVAGTAVGCSTGTDEEQVPCMAVQLALCVCLRSPHHLLMVEHNIMAIVGGRHWAHWIPDNARLSRW